MALEYICMAEFPEFSEKENKICSLATEPGKGFLNTDSSGALESSGEIVRPFCCASL
jgi:hypothetical protein